MRKRLFGFVGVRLQQCNTARWQIGEGQFGGAGHVPAFVLRQCPNHGAAKVGGKKTQALIVAATLLRKSYAFAFEAKQK